MRPTRALICDLRHGVVQCGELLVCLELPRVQILVLALEKSGDAYRCPTVAKHFLDVLVELLLLVRIESEEDEGVR